MRKSQLKQLIKEELQKEIKVNPIDNLSYLKKMVEGDFNGLAPIQSFSTWDSLEEWMNEGDYDEDDNSLEAKEILELAKMYYMWQDKGLIYFTVASNYDKFTIQRLTKPFKTLLTYGDGYEYVYMIFAVF